MTRVAEVIAAAIESSQQLHEKRTAELVHLEDELRLLRQMQDLAAGLQALEAGEATVDSRPAQPVATARPVAAAKKRRGRPPALNERGERLPTIAERILAVLAHRDDADARELSEALGASLPAVHATLARLAGAEQLQQVAPKRGRVGARYAVPGRATVVAAPPPSAAEAPAISRRVARALQKEENAPLGERSIEAARAQELLRAVLRVLADCPMSVRDVAAEIEEEPADTALAVRKLVTIGRLRPRDDGRFELQAKNGDDIEDHALAAAGVERNGTTTYGGDR